MLRLGLWGAPPPGAAGYAAAMPAPVVAHLLEMLAREGHPAAEWAARAGIPRTDPAGDLVLAFPQVARFLTEVVREFPDRPLGMQAGARPLLQSFGMLGVAVQTADDVEGAVNVGLQYHQAAGSLVDFSVDAVGDALRLAVVPRSMDPELLPFLCEETLLSVTTLLRSALGDERWSPVLVELPYPAPSYAAEYPRGFGCPVRFDAPSGRMTVPRSLLGTPLPRREPAVHAAALAACRALTGTRAEARDLDHVWAVEQLLRADLRRPFTMAGVARQLNTTERTLRRHLVEAGESFRSIHTRVRRERAEDLLRTTGLPVRSVAEAVGFADARDFRRAFAQWTGRTPAEVRARGEIRTEEGGSTVTPS
ncbi:AraC family transcriptional regulator [Tsukamurella ocularis]|uniref:AraC family transcriptional regulator n=1 Tax=Tsukamurella ocularis TaxID=1970234 RepID=UPI002167F7D5|nr:AraC family transcriptional regulator [Tsukamurella ocularis]MCS3782300.1 AraC-like DNA-binding protein [Tsukamurella ocularis]MCS3789540.1 AraC-like DNA-binding protein [Tsukamurella ocularis]MCS3852687.1 AraC-like DNA-binding protein [Tsukamurella ocularis]